MNLTACRRLALQPINAIWYRALAAEYFPLGKGMTPYDHLANIPPRRTVVGSPIGAEG
jgi:hypothetical protein